MLAQSLYDLKKLQSQGIDLALDILVAAIVFLVFLIAALVARKAIRAAIGRMSTQGHVDHIVAQLVYAAILIVGAVVALSATERVNVAALVTSFGLAGFAVGFAIKDILGNFLSGILILVQRPFAIGDDIALSGIEGRVESVRVRDTLIKTNDGTLVYVPNNIVFNNIVTNKSAFGVRPVTCRFRCDRQADVNDVLTLCSKFLSSHAEILPTPAPRVFLEELAEDGLGFQLKFWVNSQESSAEAIKSLILQQINNDLLARGVRFLNVNEAKIEESP